MRCRIMSVLFVLMIFCCRPGIAQFTQLRIPSRSASTFIDALTYLSENCHVTFIVEGSPLHPGTEDSQIKTLTQPGSLEDVVERVADAYDYSVYRPLHGRSRYAGVYVLRKRYTNLNDLPAVSYEECVATYRRVYRMLEPYIQEVAIPDYSDFVQNLAKSLSAKQKQALKTGTLRIGQLDEYQLRQVRHMAMYFYVGFSMEDTVAGYKNISQNKVTLCERTLTSPQMEYRVGEVVPGLEYYNPRNTARFFAVFFKEHALEDQSHTDINALEKLAFWATNETTLGDAVHTLRTRHDGKIEVDDELLNKPLLLVGANHANTLEILRSIADVFGLRYVRTSTRTMIRVPAMPKIEDVTDIHSAIWAAMPDPVQRATAYHPSRTHNKKQEELAQLIERMKHMKPDAEGDAAWRRYVQLTKETEGEGAYEKNRVMLMQRKAARVVREGGLLNLQSIIDKHKGIPFERLDLRTRNAQGVMEILGFLSAQRFRNNKVPYIISNFDNLTLVGGSVDNNGVPNYRIGLCRPDANGKSVMVADLCAPIK